MVIHFPKEAHKEVVNALKATMMLLEMAVKEMNLSLLLGDQTSCQRLTHGKSVKQQGV